MKFLPTNYNKCHLLLVESSATCYQLDHIVSAAQLSYSGSSLPLTLATATPTALSPLMTKDSPWLAWSLHRPFACLEYQLVHQWFIVYLLTHLLFIGSTCMYIDMCVCCGNYIFLDIFHKCFLSLYIYQGCLVLHIFGHIS